VAPAAAKHDDDDDLSSRSRLLEDASNAQMSHLYTIVEEGGEAEDDFAGDTSDSRRVVAEVDGEDDCFEDMPEGSCRMVLEVRPPSVPRPPGTYVRDAHQAVKVK